MTLTRIHHVALIVRDADQALSVYRDALGLSVSRDEILDDQGVRGILLPLSNAEIEIIQPIRDGTGVADFLAAKGEGLHHICFESDAVAADLRAAKQAGMRVIDEEPHPGLAGLVGFIHPRSNHGVLVEYAQPAAGSAHHAPPVDSAVPHRLIHPVIAAHDTAAAAQTFTRHFGLTAAGSGRYDALGLESRFLHIGPSEIEIAAPINDDERNPLVRRLRDGEGMFLISLAVADAAKAVTRLRAAGLDCTDTVPVGDSVGTFLSPKTANGVRILLTQERPVGPSSCGRDRRLARPGRTARRASQRLRSAVGRNWPLSRGRLTVERARSAVASGYRGAVARGNQGKDRRP